MNISFLVTVHNEGSELYNLLNQLVVYKQKNKNCEIVVLDDHSDDQSTLNVLDEFKEHIRLEQHSLNGDFGEHKQYGNSICRGNYIFQLDADEYLNQDFLDNLEPLLGSNPEVDLYMVPRVNRINGLAEENVKKWGWRLSVMDGLVETRNNLSDEEYKLLKDNNLILNEDNGSITFRSVLINWPDFQFRLYKNSSNIKWERKLHELIVGATTITHLPHTDYTWAIFHDKSIEKQESQNMFYISNFSKELNVRK